MGSCLNVSFSHFQILEKVLSGYTGNAMGSKVSGWGTIQVSPLPAAFSVTNLN
jgi:hypothetical protein